MQKILYEDEPELPGWALRKAFKGELTRLQQVCTKDGTKCGNGAIVDISITEAHQDNDIIDFLITVVTDAGNIMHLNLNEFHEFYTAGDWIMFQFPTTEADEAVKKWYKDVRFEFTASRVRVQPMDTTK